MSVILNPPQAHYVHVGEWAQCYHCGVIYKPNRGLQTLVDGSFRSVDTHWCGAPWQTKSPDIPDTWVPGVVKKLTP